jgi:plasmid stability protein
MAKIQARNVDEALFERISQSAMKNERSLEGEIRLALAAAYPPPEQATPQLTLRERWLRETGERLIHLLEQLQADNYFGEYSRDNRAGIADLVRAARLLDVSPGLLMDISEGRQELSVALAETIAGRFDASADWLLTGEGKPFPVRSLGDSYHDFFLPREDMSGWRFELMRICGGRHDATLLCLRQSPEGRLTLGAVSAEFVLGDGMGGTGRGKLQAFLTFLKTSCTSLQMDSYEFEDGEGLESGWEAAGRHHPVWFRRLMRRSHSRWLTGMLNGESPAWLTDFGYELQEIAGIPPAEPGTGDGATDR